MKYKGTIIQESLTDDRILNEYEFVGFKVTNEDNPADRWHLFTVLATKEQVKKLSGYLKPEKWYAHFWSGDDIIAIFPGKAFHFKYSDHATWKEAVEFGKSLNIPEDQLTFVIEE